METLKDLRNGLCELEVERLAEGVRSCSITDSIVNHFLGKPIVMLYASVGMYMGNLEWPLMSLFGRRGTLRDAC